MADIVSKKCFVIGPIGTAGSPERIQADWLFNGILLPAFRDNFSDFTLERADTISTPGLIDHQIIQRLLEVDLVIADLSFLNANAFYELGIRHMTFKPTVHMCSSDFRIPFDVSLYRAIMFSTKQHSDLEEAKRVVLPAIAEAIEPKHEVINPITRVRGQMRIEQTATPTERLILDRLETLELRLTREGGMKTFPRGRQSLSSSPLTKIQIKVNPYTKVYNDAFEEICKRELGTWSEDLSEPGVIVLLTPATFSRTATFGLEIKGLSGVNDVKINSIHE